MSAASPESAWAAAVGADDGEAVLQILPRGLGGVFQKDPGVRDAVRPQPDGHGLGLGDALVVTLPAGDDHGRGGVGVEIIQRRVQAVFHRVGGRHAVHFRAEHDEKVCFGVCVRVRAAQNRQLQNCKADRGGEHDCAQHELSRERQPRKQPDQHADARQNHADVFGRRRDAYDRAGEHDQDGQHERDRVFHLRERLPLFIQRVQLRLHRLGFLGELHELLVVCGVGLAGALQLV